MATAGIQEALIVCHAALHLPGFAVEARARTGRLEALSRAATNRTFSALSLHAANIISTLIYIISTRIYIIGTLIYITSTLMAAAAHSLESGSA